MSKMAELITFLDKNGKSDIYTVENIHGLYQYLVIIGSPTNLTSSGQSSHHFGASYYNKNDTSNIQTVIADIRIS